MKSFGDYLIKERNDPREFGKRGWFLLDKGDSMPTVGQDLDYYDKQGNKQYGIVKSINKQFVMTVQDGTTKAKVKLQIVQP